MLACDCSCCLAPLRMSSNSSTDVTKVEDLTMSTSHLVLAEFSGTSLRGRKRAGGAVHSGELGALHIRKKHLLSISLVTPNCTRKAIWHHIPCYLGVYYHLT